MLVKDNPGGRRRDGKKVEDFIVRLPEGLVFQVQIRLDVHAAQPVLAYFQCAGYESVFIQGTDVNVVKREVTAAIEAQASVTWEAYSEIKLAWTPPAVFTVKTPEGESSPSHVRSFDPEYGKKEYPDNEVRLEISISTYDFGVKRDGGKVHRCRSGWGSRVEEGWPRDHSERPDSDEPDSQQWARARSHTVYIKHTKQSLDRIDGTIGQLAKFIDALAEQFSPAKARDTIKQLATSSLPALAPPAVPPTKTKKGKK